MRKEKRARENALFCFVLSFQMIVVIFFESVSISIYKYEYNIIFLIAHFFRLFHKNVIIPNRILTKREIFLASITLLTTKTYGSCLNILSFVWFSRLFAIFILIFFSKTEKYTYQNVNHLRKC